MTEMYYDITTPDTAYDWLYGTLKIKPEQFFEDYLLKCNKNIDVFCELYLEQIMKIDINNLEIIAFQVTSSGNHCKSIRENGIRNLQWVLSHETEINSFLQSKGIRFDVNKKLMFIDSQVYDVDYEKYKNKWNSGLDAKLKSIAHKLYDDYQINAFLYCEDIFRYSTIHEAPEFFYNLSELGKTTQQISNAWENQSHAYVIKYKAKVGEFASFGELDSSILEDRENNWYCLRKKLISWAVDGLNGELKSEVIAYMKSNTIIQPENIIDIVSAKEWRQNVLKYFGKA